jgi:hypothetical protein
VETADAAHDLDEVVTGRTPGEETAG